MGPLVWSSTLINRSLAILYVGGITAGSSCLISGFSFVLGFHPAIVLIHPLISSPPHFRPSPGVKRWYGKIVVLKQFSKVICPNECCWTRKRSKIPSLTAAEKLNSDWAGSLLKLAKVTANNTWWTRGQGLCSKIPVALPFMNIYHCTMVSCFFLYIFKWTDIISYIRSMHCLKCIFWILMSQSFLELEIQTLPLLSLFYTKLCFLLGGGKCVIFF